VVVPGIFTQPLQHWHDANGEIWVRKIPSDIAPGTTVLAFQHGITPTDAFSWQGLLAQGDDFLMSLLQLKEDEKVYSAEYAARRAKFV
jgi:hypothetical protein